MKTPGFPGNGKYPGAVFKLDANGKVVARFDLLGKPIESWTFAGALLCARWGDDIVFVATPFPFSSVPRYEFEGRSLVQNIVIRLSADLIPMWTHSAPVYSTEIITGARPLARSLDSGHLLLGEGEQFSIIDKDGAIEDVRAFDNSKLVVDTSNTTAAHVFGMDPLASAWQSLTIGESLHLAKSLPFRLPSDDYEIVSAVMLDKGNMAVGAYKHGHPAILLFDSTCRYLSTIPFPSSSIFSADNGILKDLQPTENDVAALTQTFQSGGSTTSVTWIAIH